MKIIDIHAHTEFSLERLIRIHESFKRRNLSKEKFLKDLEKTKTEYVFSIGKKDGNLRKFFKNNEIATIDDIIEEKAESPFLKRIMAINFDRRKNLKEMEKYLEKDLILGIKIYLGYNIKNPNHKKLKSYYELAGKYKKPILFHTGHCFPARYNIMAEPENLKKILEKYPKQKFILCHFGHPKIEEAAEIIKDYDNAYTDLSGLMTSYDINVNYSGLKP